MRLIVPKDTESCSLIDVQVGKALHPNLHEVNVFLQQYGRRFPDVVD